MATTQAQPISGDATPYIRASAQAHGVDPNVAVAMAMGEGGVKSPGPIGDSGTSFGPYQLHAGGALPSSLAGDKQAAQRWAWSPQGIDYAMVRIAAVTKGLDGIAAIRAGVINFERPAAPGPEIQRDTSYYNALAGRGGGPGVTAISGGAGAGAATPTAGGGSSSSNPGGMLFQCGSSGHGGINIAGHQIIGNVVSTPDIGCYLKDTLLAMAYALGGLGAIIAGVMLVWPRGGKMIKKVVPLAGAVVAPEAAVAEGVGAKAAAAQVREGRAAELHTHRTAQARARTREVRARARTAESRARQEKLATGSPTRLSAVEEARIRRAQSRVGNSRPDRM